MLAACATTPRLERFEYQQPKMGTLFRLVLYAPMRALADAAAHEAFERLDDLDARLSDYEPDSELNRLARSTGPVVVSDDLWAVLERALAISTRSDGAFDVTVGPLSKLWRRAMRQGELPDGAKLAAALQLVGSGHVRMLDETREVELLLPGMQLDLGGIAKGFALDQVLATVARFGIDRALVAGGGDIAVGAAPPGSTGWTITIESLAGATAIHVTLVRAAIATSGDTYRFLEIDGRRYSHVIDPRTGLALTTRAGASVIAGDGMTADALATALCVLTPDRGLTLSRSLDCEARIVTIEDGTARVRTSAGFDRLVKRD